MESVNNILKEQITKLNYTLIPPGCQGDVRTLRMVQETLGNVIDSLGEQSAAAQGLSKVMTTAEKLRNAQTHTLYLLKDPAAKNGDGEVIGFLKVAYKHLYMFDEKNLVHQVEPLCVLDFYVSGARQRNGNGKKLFDYMLQDTGSNPQKLAVDGPSPKMESFLKKNYGVNQLIRQSNNFAVSPAFFITADDVKSGRTSPAPSAPVGRYAARKPTSSIGDIIHGAPERQLYVDTTNGQYGNQGGGQSPQPRLPSPRLPSPNLDPPIERDIPIPPVSPNLERPTTLSVGRPVSGPPSPAGSSTPRRDSQLTDQGYMDMKFYHNKLW